MEIIAELTGTNPEQLRAILWSHNGAIVGDAALYAYLKHKNQIYDKIPDKIMIYMTDIIVPTIDNESYNIIEYIYFCVYRLIMEKLGYVANEIPATSNWPWTFYYSKKGYIDIHIKLNYTIPDDIYIISSYNSSKFMGVNDEL
jgi:hypothetical protein